MVHGNTEVLVILSAFYRMDLECECIANSFSNEEDKDDNKLSQRDDGEERLRD